MGLGRVKTKSDLVVMAREDKFLHFFALRVTVEPKIPVRLYRVEFLHSQGQKPKCPLTWIESA
jgi:hypothetical protein